MTARGCTIHEKKPEKVIIQDLTPLVFFTTVFHKLNRWEEIIDN